MGLSGLSSPSSNPLRQLCCRGEQEALQPSNSQALNLLDSHSSPRQTSLLREKDGGDKGGELEQSPIFHRGHQNQGAIEGTPMWERVSGREASRRGLHPIQTAGLRSQERGYLWGYCPHTRANRTWRTPPAAHPPHIRKGEGDDKVTLIISSTEKDSLTPAFLRLPRAPPS